MGLYVAQVLAYITTEDGGVTLYSLGVQPATHMNLIRAPPPFIKRLSTSWIVGRGSLLYQNLLICWTKLSIKIITCKLSLYFLSSLLDQECRVSLVLKDLPEWWISFNLETRFPQLYDMRSEKSFEEWGPSVGNIRNHMYIQRQACAYYITACLYDKACDLIFMCCTSTSKIFCRE